MTIREQLNIINSVFVKLHNDFTRIDEEIKKADEAYHKAPAKAQSGTEAEKARLDALRADIMNCVHIAEENTQLRLTPFEKPPLKPDIPSLSNAVLAINTYNPNDPNAGRVIDLAGRYLSFINKELAAMDGKREAELKAAAAKRNNDIAALNAKKKKILSDCESYLGGNDVKNLVKLFEMIHTDYEIHSGYFENFGAPKKHVKMMLFGFMGYELDAPKILLKPLKRSFGEHFDENTRRINCPCGFVINAFEEMRAEYVDRNEAELKRGITAMILNYMRYLPLSEFRASVFDSIHLSGELIGAFSALAGAKNGFIESIPYNADTMKKAACELTEKYRGIASKIGSVSVAEYNKTCPPKSRIPLRLLFICREASKYQQHTAEDTELAYIVNNAAKFGVKVIFLEKSTDGGSKGKEREKELLKKPKELVRIISGADGGFFIENDGKWAPFKWLGAPERLPSRFLSAVENMLKPAEIGREFFKRYTFALPKKSRGKRKPIEVPFAVDEDDEAVPARFEENTFAAYMMGASGSGKSTLLHTMITYLIMNYHPDEVELWLMDFKMMEFKRYVKHLPPHIKYILLEKSEDLVFDIIDNLTAELERRQFLFSQKGWAKLADVPPEENIPAIFVIIDEFAQMSQIIKDTKGSGHGSDYTLKLENLLTLGRGTGFKFIFASQEYTTGTPGLTDTARGQIQLRFALKNSADEIKQTLALTSEQITPRLGNEIVSIQPYETIFSRVGGDKKRHTGKYRNMYTENGQPELAADKIRAAMRSVGAGNMTDDASYIDKKPVLIDGSFPKTFKSQSAAYHEYEAALNKADMDEADILMYPGVPCSFVMARPFTLTAATAENILLVGGGRDNLVNVCLSLLNSYRRSGNDIEIWAHDHSKIIKKYGASVFSKIKRYTELEDICGRVHELKEAVKDKSASPRLIVCFDYAAAASDMEIFGDGKNSPEKKRKTSAAPAGGFDLNALLAQANGSQSDDEKRKLISDYNSGVAASSPGASDDGAEEYEHCVYDAREDVKWLVQRASKFSVHFLFCFESGVDYTEVKFGDGLFRHKLLFSMSKDEVFAVSGNKKASEIDDGVFLYTDGKASVTYRPHIYRGISCNGWMLDDKGELIQTGGK